MTKQTNLEDKIREILDGEGSAADKIQAIYEDLLPDPMIPGQLFLAKATHLNRGEGVVTSHFPVVDGTVRFMFPDEASNDGTAFQWVDTSTLTFHTPDHPEFLETEEDFENAPENTVAARDEYYPIVKIVNLWTDMNGLVYGPKDLVSSARSPIHVLRWGDSK